MLMDFRKHYFSVISPCDQTNYWSLSVTGLENLLIKKEIEHESEMCKQIILVIGMHLILNNSFNPFYIFKEIIYSWKYTFKT